ncbi:SDR family oxidoreductase [Actinosynnema sp. NPDC023794]
MTHRPTALVTGASAGLGVEFATQLARRGHDLVLVARSADRLDALADRLRHEHGAEVDVVVQDLSAPDAVDSIAARLPRPVHTLVNNAGFGTAGRFEEIPDGHDQEQLMVNVVALVGLTRALVPGMLEAGSGAVVNVGSTAGFQPSPYFATYSAGKAFVLNFSLALRREYRDRGIKVLALCPGPTETSFFDRVTPRAAIGGRMMSAEAVVRAALDGLDRDRAYVTPGLRNALSAHLIPRRPRTAVAAIAERVTRSVLQG